MKHATHYRSSWEISDEVAVGYLRMAKDSVRRTFIARHEPDLFPDEARRRLTVTYRYDVVKDQHWIDVDAWGPLVEGAGPKTFHQDQPDQTGPGITNQEGK